MDLEFDAAAAGAGAHLEDEAWPGTYPNSSDEKFLTIAEMARAFSLTPRALRFYEGKGLLSPQRQGATRRYGRADRNRLSLVLQAKRLGFTLCEIRQMLAAPSHSAEAAALNISRRQCFEQIKLLEQRKRDIEAALTELRRTYSAFYARMVAGQD
jgi:DNA-binding transcriptional MerR regulator